MSEQPTPKARQRTIEGKAEQPTWPPACDPSDIYALQACYHGRATPDQQTRAIEFIRGVMCQLHLDPPEANDQATFRAIGRQSVGRLISSLLTVRINPKGEQP